MDVLSAQAAKARLRAQATIPNALRIVTILPVADLILKRRALDSRNICLRVVSCHVR
jgi:hypothetical protein